MGSTSTSTLAVNIIGNASGLNSTMGGVSSLLNGLTSGPMGAVVAGAALVTGAIVGIGVASTKMAANFQTGVTSLVTGAGESASNLGKVSSGIMDLAVQTGTSTQQLISGMYMIESAGYHGGAGLDVLKVAAEGAKVGSADLGTVADALTTILTDYHMKGDQAAQAMNALTATVASGKTHLQDLSASLAAVLPLASSLGLSFPQVAGALATMTNAGMSAQHASQNLANAIRSLAAPNATAQKAMRGVGLSAEELHNTLTNKGLAAAIQEVSDAVGKKFPAGSLQATEAFKAIMGGAVGYNVALMLGGKNMAAYQGNIATITGAMKNGSGAVTGWSAVQGTFNQKLSQAREVFEVLMIKIGTGLLPVLSRLLDAVTPLLIGFTNLVTNGKTLSSVFAPIQPILSGMGVLFKLIGGILSTMGSEIASTLAPTWKQLWMILSQELWPALQQLWNALQPLTPLFEDIGVIVGGVVVTALGILVGVLQGVITGLGMLLAGVAKAITGVIQVITGLVTFISGALSLIFDLFTGNSKGIQKDLQTMASGIGQIFLGLFNVVYGLVSGLCGAIIGFIIGLVEGVVNWFTHLYDVLVGHSIIPDMVNGIVQWIEQLPGRAMSAISSLVSQITSTLGNLGTKALGWAGDMISGFVQGIQNGIGAVGNAVANIASAISSRLHFTKPDIGPLANFDTYAPDMIDLFVNGITSNVGKVGTAIGTFAQTVSTGMHPSSNMMPTSGIYPRTGMSASSAPNSNAGDQTIELHVDGELLTRIVGTRLYRNKRLYLGDRGVA